MTLYRDYDPEVLQQLQETILDMLKDFTELCEKNNIDYFAVGGTAIGAVRHQGIIPWDDDIDIGFTRENYDKFLQVAAEQYTDKYKVINFETTKNYPLMTTRWALRDSAFKEESFKNLDVDNGIFLDLYCFDNIYDDEKKMRRQGRKAWFWGKLLVLYYIPHPVLYYKGISAKIIHLGCSLGNNVLKLLIRNPKIFYDHAQKYSSELKNVSTQRVAYFFDPTPFTSIMKIEDILPTKFMDFNGIQLRCPNNIGAYLSTRYGDYMTLPKKEDRHNHPPFELRFPKEKTDLH